MAAKIEFDDVHKRMVDIVTPYFVAIVGDAGPRGRHEDAGLELIGCGTLVTLLRERGVLTADHVLKSTRDYPSIRVAGADDESRNSLDPRKLLARRRFSEDDQDLLAPDISFIQLPPEAILDFEKAGRVFYDLEASRKLTSQNAACAVGDPRFAVGSISDYAHAREIEDNVETFRRMTLSKFCYKTDVVSLEEKDGFDFVTVSVSPEDKDKDVFPDEYGGYSGSGVWRMGHKDENGNLVGSFDQITLDAVVLRHDRSKKALRAHGLKSIESFLDCPPPAMKLG